MKSSSSLLILTEDSPDSYSPAGERVRHMALAGKFSFRKTLVLSLRGNTGENRKRNADSEVSLYSVNFVRAAPFPISGFFDPVKFLILTVHGLKVSRLLRPSVVLVSMPPLETGAAAWLLARLLGVKLVVDLRDDWESAVGSQLKKYFPPLLIRLLSRFAREIYSLSTNIFVVTQHIADTLHSRGIATPTFLVSNGADTSVFVPESVEFLAKARRKYALPANRLVVIYCGSGVNPYYRLDLIMQSINSLSTDLKKKLFVVFYVYNGLENLRKLKSRLAMPDSLLEVRAPLPRRSLAEVIGASDVGLVPFDEGAYLLCARSAKLYEYLSSGLYVISSGPSKGELDLLFSASPDLGLFTRPSVEGFAQAFNHIAENKKVLLDHNSRVSRHAFIRENYDRQIIMRKALETLVEKSDY